MPLSLFVGGLPGGVEILVVLLIAVFLFGVPLAVVVGFVALSRARRGEPVSETDVEEIQEQLAELQAAVDEVREEDGNE